MEHGCVPDVVDAAPTNLVEVSLAQERFFIYLCALVSLHSHRHKLYTYVIEG